MSANVPSNAFASAHAKLILVGEHSVVYGKPAIAVPFPLEVHVKIEAVHGVAQLVSDLYQGNIDQVPESLKGLSASIKAVMASLGKDGDGLKIVITSDIPVGRGMGSSAAVAVAVLRCLYNYYGQQVTDETLFKGVRIAEAHCHGNASGIDMTTVAGKTPILFERARGMHAIQLKAPLYMAVADTGQEGNTRRAVDLVRKHYISSEHHVQKILDTMGGLAKLTEMFLKSGNLRLLGYMMDRNHAALRDLGVSNEAIEQLVKTGKAHGALGAKLTGGGLGGCVIALADNLTSAARIAEAFVADGAAKAWYFSSHQNKLTTIERPVLIHESNS